MANDNGWPTWPLHECTSRASRPSHLSCPGLIDDKVIKHGPLCNKPGLAAMALFNFLSTHSIIGSNKLNGPIWASKADLSDFNSSIKETCSNKYCGNTRETCYPHKSIEKCGRKIRHRWKWNREIVIQQDLMLAFKNIAAKHVLSIELSNHRVRIIKWNCSERLPGISQTFQPFTHTHRYIQCFQTD